MYSEDRLDALLTAQLRASHTAEVDEPGELIPLVEAAQRLGALRHVDPTPDFAHALEQRLLARAELAVLRPARGQVREMLTQDRSRSTMRQRLRAPRWASLAAALLLLVIGAGTLTAAAAAAAPGSPLYGLHRLEQGMRAQLTTNAADRAHLHLTFANQALSALTTAAAEHDMRAYQDALATLREELVAARAAVGQVPASQAHDALDAELAGLIAQARAGLLAMLSQVDWQERLATTSALGDLGLPTPAVASARVLEQNRGGQEVWLIILTGSGFQPGAQVVLDGQPIGSAETGTPGSLHLTLSNPPDSGPHTIGILNADGTAAETSHITVIVAGPGKDSTPSGTPTSTNGPSDSGEKHGGHTPTPIITPTHTPTAH